MKFLAIDTSGKQLNVVAVNGERQIVSRRGDCAMQHSVLLMDEIDEALKAARLSPADCDFFACVAGPGSFTGIRIGIATVKGLCLACQKPALPLTSFDTIAYADKSERNSALWTRDTGIFMPAAIRAFRSFCRLRFYRGKRWKRASRRDLSPWRIRRSLTACGRRTRRRGFSMPLSGRRTACAAHTRWKPCICARVLPRNSDERAALAVRRPFGDRRA